MPLSSNESALAAPTHGNTTDFTVAEAFTLGTASATCALIVLDTNVVAVSLPAIARSFHASFAAVEWVVSTYMVTFAACLLPAGAIADKVGRKKMLLAGFAHCVLFPIHAILHPVRSTLPVACCLQVRSP